MEAAPKPDGAPEQAPAKAELPTVESPPTSPGAETPVKADGAEPVVAPPAAPAADPIAAAVPASEPELTAGPTAIVPLRFALRPRHKRHALLAASVTLAAALGAIVGAVASGGFAPPPRVDVARVEENKAMQQSLTRLAREVTTLKANLEAANKASHSQIAKINERFEQQAAEITGSIAPPQTAAPAPATAAAAPLPTPRPAIAEAAPPARAQVVQGWTIRDTRSGYVYVQNRGAIYQVVPGAPLPGLGPVESIRRQDGRWIVVTPKGMIVSMRDRRYFDPY